jgi:hypothetical protein
MYINIYEKLTEETFLEALGLKDKEIFIKKID